MAQGTRRRILKGRDVVESVWTGVVPIYETVGEPVRGGAGRVEKVPEHITSFRGEVNETNEEYARTAAAAMNPAGKGY